MRRTRFMRGSKSIRKSLAASQRRARTKCPEKRLYSSGDSVRARRWLAAKREALDGLSVSPIHAWRIGPEVFEPVIIAGVLIEDVDHDIAVILHHPAAGLIARNGEAFLPFGAKGRIDLLGQRMYLAPA